MHNSPCITEVFCPMEHLRKRNLLLFCVLFLMGVVFFCVFLLPDWISWWRDGFPNPSVSQAKHLLFMFYMGATFLVATFLYKKAMLKIIWFNVCLDYMISVIEIAVYMLLNAALDLIEESRIHTLLFCLWILALPLLMICSYILQKRHIFKENLLHMKKNAKFLFLFINLLLILWMLYENIWYICWVADMWP